MLQRAIAIGIVCGTVYGADDDQLKRDLLELDSLRNGLNTPLDDIEARGQLLLDKYSAPDDVAQIYRQLAHIHAQSGVQRPDLIELYARKAFDLPLPADERLLLFIYHGDSRQVLNRTLPDSDQLPFEEIRKLATGVYLEGLADSIEHQIPDKRPDDAVPDPLITPMGDPNDPQFRQAVAEFERANNEFAAERERVQRLQAAWDYRRMLYDQIVYLYFRSPRAQDEMRALAESALPRKMVDHLIRRFDELDAKWDDTGIASGDTDIESPQSKPNMSGSTSDGWFLWLVGLNLAGLVLAICLYVYRRKSRS